MKAEALRQAQLEVRDYEDSNGNYHYQNPYYSAAIVLSGDEVGKLELGVQVQKPRWRRY